MNKNLKILIFLYLLFFCFQAFGKIVVAICSGTPDPCSSHAEPTCVSCGCSWTDPYCSIGISCCSEDTRCLIDFFWWIDPCGHIGAVECPITECPSESTCGSYTDYDSCMHGNCWWYEGECSGTPDPCSSHAEPTCVSCGCTWITTTTTSTSTTSTTVPECNSCEVRNLNCPPSVDIEQEFEITYEIYGTGPTEYPYEIQTIESDSTEELCIYTEDNPECIWHTKERTLIAPSEANTYTYTVKCYGAESSSSNHCGEYDDYETCDIEVSGDTGLGYPIIDPRPVQWREFNIACPANANYGCIHASYEDESGDFILCDYVEWKSGARVFECSGRDVGFFTAKCEALENGGVCIPEIKTKEYEVLYAPDYKITDIKVGSGDEHPQIVYFTIYNDGPGYAVSKRGYSYQQLYIDSYPGGIVPDTGTGGMVLVADLMPYQKLKTCFWKYHYQETGTHEVFVEADTNTDVREWNPVSDAEDNNVNSTDIET